MSEWRDVSAVEAFYCRLSVASLRTLGAFVAHLLKLVVRRVTNSPFEPDESRGAALGPLQSETQAIGQYVMLVAQRVARPGVIVWDEIK